MLKEIRTELKPDETSPETASLLADLEKNLESVKWNLWHGNVPHALERIEDLDDDLEMWEEPGEQEKTAERRTGIPRLNRSQP